MGFTGGDTEGERGGLTEDSLTADEVAHRAGIAPAAPKPVAPTAVTPVVDYKRIEEIVEKVVTTAASLKTQGDSRYWSPERAAYECDVCERTFAEWMAVGKVRFYKPCGRVLIDPKELKEDLTKFRRRRTPKRRKRH